MKKIIQDIVRKKSLEKPRIILQDRKQQEVKEKIPLVLAGDSNKSWPWFKIFFWILTVAIVVFFISITIDFFSSVTVTIIPKQKITNVDTQFTAKKGSKENGIGFEISQFPYEDSKIAVATGSSKEEKKAKGQVIIYNTNSVAQKLVAQTRFAEPKGKIYRIQTTIIVPAQSSMEATLYADKAGASYNIGLTDFTLPAFKGEGRYKTIYARSKTEMKGGSSGTVKVVSKDDLEKARAELKSKIETYLKENVFKQQQLEYVYYKDALKLDFSDDVGNPAIGDVADTFVFKEKGDAVGFLLKENTLQMALVGKYEKTNNVSVVNLNDLKFNLISTNENNTEMTFTLKGKARFVWNIDKNSIIKSLMAVTDRKFEKIFANYSNIATAEIIFKPSWWRFMPKDSKKINIMVSF